MSWGSHHLSAINANNSPIFSPKPPSTPRAPLAGTALGPMGSLLSVCLRKGLRLVCTPCVDCSFECLSACLEFAHQSWHPFSPLRGACSIFGHPTPVYPDQLPSALPLEVTPWAQRSSPTSCVVSRPLWGFPSPGTENPAPHGGCWVCSSLPQLLGTKSRCYSQF